MLLQILAAWPAPAPPQCTIFLPILSSTGLAAAKDFASPPHMKVSVAPLAPPVPPDTGASTEPTPCFAASACACFALSTSMVEQSIIIAPLVMEGTISVHTDSTCLPAGNMVTTVSAPFTALAAVSAMAAPSLLACLRKPSTRSKATTLWPALTRLAAMGPPILPRPMNAIVDIKFPPLGSHAFILIDRTPVRRRRSRQSTVSAFAASHPRSVPATISDCGPCQSPQPAPPRENRRSGTPQARHDTPAPDTLPECAPSAPAEAV